jgi:hypothetical protein
MSFREVRRQTHFALPNAPGGRAQINHHLECDVLEANYSGAQVVLTFTGPMHGDLIIKAAVVSTANEIHSGSTVLSEVQAVSELRSLRRSSD